MTNVQSSVASAVRVSDMCGLARKRSSPVFSAFMNECEQYEAARALKANGDIYGSFFGGYEYSIRKILCVSVYEDDTLNTAGFPVYPLSLEFRKADSPRHKDILGAVMALGITREQVGDIFIGEGAAAIFCTATARDVILRDISTVGRIGVSISEGLTKAASGTLHPPVFEELNLSTASMRCDCVVSAVTGLSRSVTEDYIRSGRLMINYLECTDKSRTVCADDILTLRGYGKYIICADAGTTKRGRLRITVKKYV